MRQLSKVVWSEGMYLAPHHFQAQNRYFEDTLRTSAEALCFAPYGLAGCALDAEALRNGTVALVHARGILQDGLCFQAPESDRLPDPLSAAAVFPPTASHILIYLATPARRTDGPNCALSPGAADGCRYVAEERVVPDENTGAGERPVLIGRKNLSLFSGETLPRGWCALPVARVLRDGAGGFLYDADFVPPLLQIAASEGLMLRLRRLIEILDEKSASLAGRAAGSLTGLATGEIASFWLRHAINSAQASLRHIWTSKRGHPEELFVEMSRLGGALCTFSADSHPRSLPRYDHEDLSAGFAALDRHIREHLETVIPSNWLSIPLHSADPYFHEGEVADSRALGRAQWIFGIRAKMGEAALITTPPQLVKFCSTRFVRELVRRALPGLQLTHLSAPPPAAPRKVEMQYFSVSRTGPCWDHIVQTRQVGIYVPGEFVEAEVELLVALEQQGAAHGN